MWHIVLLLTTSGCTYRLTSALPVNANKLPRTSPNYQYLPYVSAGKHVLDDHDKPPTHKVSNSVLRTSSELNDFLNQEDQQKLRDYELKCDDDELCHRSLCPWNIQVNENQHRSPKYLKYAECRTTKCRFNFTNIAHSVEHRMQYATHCATVEKSFTVFLHGKETTEIWPVACACSINRAHYGNHVSNNRDLNQMNGNVQSPDAISLAQQRGLLSRLPNTRPDTILEAESTGPYTGH